MTKAVILHNNTTTINEMMIGFWQQITARWFSVKRSKIIKRMIAITMILVIACMQTGYSSQVTDQRKHVRILILPKFEIGDMAGDFPGEAQYFYEEYLAGGDTYTLNGCPGSIELYYRDGVALCPIGMGKITAALNTAAILSDTRFDFSDAYILSVGCGGVAEGYGVMGDVYVISAAVDYDLGHRADPREMSVETETTWFHDGIYDDSAVIRLDQNLTDRVYSQVKNVSLQTTDQTMRYLQREYPDEAWANWQPQVKRGTSVTGDNFWKGRYGHQNALLITDTYGCSDPYAITEMEDIAVGQAVKCHGMLDRLIILRVGVNMDVFPKGVTPEMLWGPASEDDLASEESMESVDIFETAMHNCFSVGKVLIDAVLDGANQREDCAAEQLGKYRVEENTAENKATYPYIVRTESSIWYLAKDDIALMGEDAFFDGLRGLLQYQDADFADARAALAGFIREETEPVEIRTDFCGKAGISELEIIGAYYNPRSNFIKVFRNWEVAKAALLHEYVHYLTMHSTNTPVTHGLFAEGIAEYISAIVCKNRMRRDFSQSLSEEEKIFLRARGAWDREEDCLDLRLYEFGMAETYAQGVQQGTEYLSTIDVPTIRTPEIEQNPTAENITHEEAACILAYLVETCSRGTVFSHLNMDPADMDKVFGETFADIYVHWKEWNSKLFNESGMILHFDDGK